MWNMKACLSYQIRYAKMQVVQAPGMLGTFSPPPRVSDPDMHHDTCVTPVPWCMSGSLTNGFSWSHWRWKRSRHSRGMRNLQFCISSKRPICQCLHSGCRNKLLIDKTAGGQVMNDWSLVLIIRKQGYVYGVLQNNVLGIMNNKSNLRNEKLSVLNVKIMDILDNS